MSVPAVDQAIQEHRAIKAIYTATVRDLIPLAYGHHNGAPIYLLWQTAPESVREQQTAAWNAKYAGLVPALANPHFRFMLPGGISAVALGPVLAPGDLPADLVALAPGLPYPCVHMAPVVLDWRDF